MEVKQKTKQFDIIKGQHGLCWRCEHRALFHDSAHSPHPHRPRYECGDTNSAKYSCYCYAPVNPLVIERDKGEKRPIFAGWLLAGRGHAVGLAVTQERAFLDYGKIVVWHEPITLKQKEADQKEAGRERSET